MPLIELYHQTELILQLSGAVKLNGNFSTRRLKESKNISLFPANHRLEYISASDHSRNWQALSRDMTGDELPYPFGSICGNEQVYRSLLHILDASGDIRSDISAFRFFSHIASIRAYRGASQSEALDIKEGIDLHHAILLTAVHDELHSLVSKSTHISEENIRKMDKFGDTMGKLTTPTCCSELFPIKLSSCSSLFVLEVSGKLTTLSHDHMMRVVEMCIVYRNYLLLGIYNLGPGTCNTFRLLRSLTELGIRYPNKLGEGAKAARNRLVWRLNKDKVMGVSSEKALYDTYPEWKQDLSEKIISRIENYTDGVAEAISLSYYFKYVSHADFDVKACFLTTLGVKDANTVTPQSLGHLEAVLRRSIMAAASEDGEPLRLLSGDPYMVGESSSVRPNISSMLAIHYDRWKDVIFAVSPRFKNYLDKDLRVKDKSHGKAVDPVKFFGPVSLDKEYLTGVREQRKHPGTLFGSDMALKYSDEGFPSNKKAYDYVCKIIKKHRDRRSKLNRELTSRDLEEFFKDDPEAFHLVATEGKYGEYHKEVTRMFYLANAHIKTFLSLVERLIKDLTKGQMGNSIIKNYTSKERDLISLVHSVKGPDSNDIPIYLSFDMAEFSKKFPGESVDVLGKILAELTGDDILRDLSVLFKSSVVAHSTRGFYSAFAGVTGGFEGFLNFGWTTIHVAIMTLALREAGLLGFVLAYSDDGVLYFQVPGPLRDCMDDVRDAVLVIQKAYRDLGLTFHIGKMLCATKTFEYLGDIGDDGRFIDTSPKALSHFGVLELTGALNTYGSIIDSYVGQASAAIEASFPSFLLEPFLYMHIYRKLKRTNSLITPQIAVGLMIMPKSTGGFGVHPGVNLSLTASRDHSSELITDLEMIGKFYPAIVKRVCNHIMGNALTYNECIHKFMMGESVACKTPDISGNSVMAEAGNILRGKLNLPELDHPLTTIRCHRLREVLMCLTGITPKLMSLISESVPEMISYQRLMQEGKSKGALKVLTPQIIIRLQKKDTRHIKEALERFITPREAEYELEDLIAYINSNLNQCGFSLPQPSMRSFMCVSGPSRYDAVCKTSVCNLDESGLGGVRAHTIFNLSYLVQKMSTTNRTDRILFESEHTPDNNIPHRLLQVVSTIIKRHPVLKEPMMHICSILGAPMPNFLEIKPKSLERLKSLRNKPDYTLNISPLYRARTSVINSLELEKALTRMNGGDHTSLEYFSLVIGCQEFMRGCCMSKKPSSKDHRVYIEIRDVYRHLKTRDVSLIRELPKRELSFLQEDESTRRMMKNFIKDLEDEEVLSRLITLPNGSEEEMRVLARHYATKLSRTILYRLKSPSDSSFLLPFNRETTSDRFNRSIIRHCCLNIAAELTDTASESTFRSSLEKVVKSLITLGPTIPRSVCEIIVTLSWEEVCDEKSLGTLIGTLFDSTKIIVIDSGSVHSRDPVAGTIEKMLNSTIREVYRRANEGAGGWLSSYTTEGGKLIELKVGNQGAESREWPRGFSPGVPRVVSDSQKKYVKGEPVNLSKRLQLSGSSATRQKDVGRQSGRLDIDRLLDMISIGYDSVRRSSHRRTSYNRTTYEVLSYLFTMAVSGIGIKCKEWKTDKPVSPSKLNDPFGDNITSLDEYEEGEDDDYYRFVSSSQESDLREGLGKDLRGKSLEGSDAFLRFNTDDTWADVDKSKPTVSKKNKNSAPRVYLTDEAISYFMTRKGITLEGFKGTDHLSLLSSCMPHRSYLRYQIYFNDKRIARGRVMSSMEECYEESIAMQHMYSTIIENLIAKKVRPINANSVSSDHMNSSNILRFLPDPPVEIQGSYPCGQACPETKETMAVAWAHVLMLMESEGIGSIEVSEHLSIKMINAKLPNISTQNGGVPVTDMIGGSALWGGENGCPGLQIVMEAFSLAQTALLAYSLLTSAFDGSYSLMEVNGLYCVVGCLMVSESVRSIVKEDILRESTVCTDEWARSTFGTDNETTMCKVLLAAGAYTVDRSAEVLGATFLGSGGGLRRAPVNKLRIVKNADFLTAACVLSNAGATLGTSYWGYCLLMAFLEGGPNPHMSALDRWEMGIMGVNRYDRVINSGELGVKELAMNISWRRTQISGLRLAASSVRGYFLQNPIGVSLTDNIPSALLVIPDSCVPEFDERFTFEVVHRETISIDRLIELRGQNVNCDDSGWVVANLGSYNS